MAPPRFSCCLTALLVSLMLLSCSKKTAEVHNESQSLIDNLTGISEFGSIVWLTHEDLSKFFGFFPSGPSKVGLEYGDDLNSPGAIIGFSVNANYFEFDGVDRSGTIRIRVHRISKDTARMTLGLLGYHARGLHFMCDSIVMNSIFRPNMTAVNFSVFGGSFHGTDHKAISLFSTNCILGRSLYNLDGTFQGTSQGVSKNGTSYSSTFNVKKQISCKSIGYGTVTHQPQGFATRYVSFGDDEPIVGALMNCDHLAWYQVPADRNIVSVKTE